MIINNKLLVEMLYIAFNKKLIELIYCFAINFNGKEFTNIKCEYTFNVLKNWKII